MALDADERYAVIVVDRHTGQPTRQGIYDADRAHAVADEWNATHPRTAFVVGLHPENSQ
ncbi:hypothetical protein H7I87_05120 [Mycobacterium timonense]|uniref:Uncharacterized protein n=1 Tax=Mycobacterium bouchedurhonense TaxID=701041 RepID=A0AAW5SF86_MYCBC|nr:MULTISPECIES: hypothetical protein [Mycobacterium avium complex (MAC)]MCV6993142.1 hypothetical protein [Mycobacterium bouchedurhonense]MCV6994108.1 hypothetical protein [Mycobacterium timonense]MDV3307044.1 hypothetical protein [Mycobacterium avium subsp. hominissuis]